jgi:hypothetical protein
MAYEAAALLDLLMDGQAPPKQPRWQLNVNAKFHAPLLLTVGNHRFHW